MNFALEDWEWPPGSERRYLIEPFESDCLSKGGIERATVCTIPAFGGNAANVFYRPHFGPHEAKDDFTYVLCYARQPLVLYQTGVEWSPKTLANHLHNLFPRQHQSARLFHLAGEGGGACLVSEHGNNWIEPRWGTFYRSVPSSFYVPPAIKQLPSRELWQWLESEFADTNSELSYSYQWNFKNKDRRIAALETIFPVLGAQRQMMEHIARYETPAGEAIRWSFHAPTRGGAGNQDNQGTTRMPDIFFRSSPYPLPEPLEAVHERFQLWNQLLQRHFPWPQVNTRTSPDTQPALPLCLLKEYESYELTIFQEETATSQHERLEARLFLREWLAKTAPSSEIARLFPAGVPGFGRV